MHSRVLAAIATTAVALTVVAPAASAQQLTAQQGSQIVVGDSSACTIGYNDLGRGLSYTAAHCGKAGDLVRLTDSNGQLIPAPAGVFIPSTKYDSASSSNDWAAIQWNPGVAVQPNRFGGGYISSNQLRAGDQICFHGFSSHGSSNNYSCGQFIGSLGQNMYYELPVSALHGDSGGPVFVPGKGTLGVVSGADGWTNSAGTIVVQRASTLNDGPLVRQDHLEQLVFSYFGQRPARTAPAPSNAPARPPADGHVLEVQSSAGNPGSIIGIVIAILAALVPLVGGFLA